LIWGLGLVNRYFLDLREELRFILDRNLCLLRQHLVRLGKQTKLDQGVFFLTRSELKEVVSGRLDWDQAKALSTRRAESHGEHRQPWIYYVDGRGEQEFEPRKGELRGIGTSSGQVAGIAQVISDPTQARLNKEVIIVARHTDPGWTPLMGMIKGIIVEEGGLLSHCAIVAREFGIPAVVGVLQATQRITDGMSICLDGAAGIVWLEPDQGWEIP
jgi:pyruvate,water dikinase